MLFLGGGCSSQEEALAAAACQMLFSKDKDSGAKRQTEVWKGKKKGELNLVCWQ